MKKSLIVVTLVGLLLTAVAPGQAQTGVAIRNEACKRGEAGGFPCKKVDLLSYIPPGDMGGGRVADVWGWADPETGKEYALLGSTRGVLFVDVSNPTKPKYLGNLLPKDQVFIWQELEVFNDHLFVVCDLATCGLQIFDLTRLRGVDTAQRWTPDVLYPIPPAHSIDLNPKSGFLYVNGTGVGPASAQYIFDVNSPKSPVPAGITADDGYTHDSLCRNYRGADKAYKGKEICFNFNEDAITIYDMTNKAAPEQISQVTYEGASYVHSGTLTEDDAYLVSTDEGDETGVDPSTLFIWDVTDLSDPTLVAPWSTGIPAIDHNVFTLGRYIYHANYTAGLRILDTKKISSGKLKEVAYFDIVPETNDANFDGSWAVYPFLPSGTVLVGGMGQGLAVVDPRI